MKLEVKNQNYCATVVKLDRFTEVPNADKLKYALIMGNSVIVSKDTEAGTIGIFFPIETQINTKFLSAHNLFSDWTLNKANIETVKGFFTSKGRVRAVRLRGNKSEGFFVSMDSLSDEYKFLASLEVGTDFDTIDGEMFCKKYVVETKQDNTVKKPRQGKTPRISRLVDNQFRLHIDTINARKSFASHIKPNDIVSITDKYHGTSAVFANLLTKEPQKPSIIKRIKNFITRNNEVDFKETYGNIYSSRKVVKNQYLNEFKNDGFYGVDVWGHHNNQIKDIIPKGISIYGEIVGYLPKSQSMIQSPFDYGESEGESSLYVYRITFTNVDGNVYEFTWQQIKDFCVKYNLKHVREFYYGLAKDIYPDIAVDDDWHINVITRLASDFNLEKDCEVCVNKVPAEGIVIRPEKLFDCTPLKLKSFKFLQHETDLLDKGVMDIESQESSTEE